MVISLKENFNHIMDGNYPHQPTPLLFQRTMAGKMVDFMMVNSVMQQLVQTLFGLMVSLEVVYSQVDIGMMVFFIKGSLEVA